MILQLVPMLPELFLAIAAMGFLMVGAFNPGVETAKIASWFSVGAVFITLIILLNISWSDGPVLNNMFQLDGFSGVLKVLILIGLMASIALSVRYLVQENLARFEYPVLMLMAGIGMMLMVSATNFMSLYMALELQSLSLYVLAAFRRTGMRSSEAGVKYFSLGALSSGMLLFGISLIYGSTGAIDFASVEAVISAGAPLSLMVGMVFVLAGLAFKISAVPFHMGSPAGYQGAPSCVTAFFAIVPKIAAMGLIAKLVLGPFAQMSGDWGQILYALSIGSMVVGAFAGLAQENLKRLLAYSSIGNMGYVLIGLVAFSAAGTSAVILYLIIYMMATIGVFAVVLSMRRGDLMVSDIKDLAGLSQTMPAQAYALALLMFSMSGIPPLAGFFGKWAIFQAAIDAELYVLAIVGVLTSVVAAYYYLRVVKVMFFDPPEDEFNPDIPFARNLILCISIAFVTLFIAKPSFYLFVAEKAATTFFP